MRYIRIDLVVCHFSYELSERSTGWVIRAFHSSEYFSYSYCLKCRLQEILIDSDYFIPRNLEHIFDVLSLQSMLMLDWNQNKKKCARYRFQSTRHDLIN